MEKNTTKVAIVLLGLGALCVSCMLPSPVKTADHEESTPLLVDLDSHPIHPIDAVAEDPAVTKLGRRLFFEKQLSSNNTVACASCHALDQGGVDRLVHSIGVDGAEGGINAPTVLNSGLNFVQFWNGRAASLEDQVDGPTHNSKEMGSNWNQIVGKLCADTSYVDDFRVAFGRLPDADGVRTAIATFERTLTTPNSPFDRFIKGDHAAIDAEQKHGYDLFKSYGCSSCHQGTNIGGNMYQKFGLMGDYFKDRGHETDADQGRFAVTHRPEDLHVFRVPSLRNIELTRPYFHDGSAKSLPQAIEVMAQYQLGRPMPPDDLRAIARFLMSLTGDQPKGEGS